MKTILIITDGIGHNACENNNAFAKANTPTYDELFKNTPFSLIATSGLAVGLPEGQMGNSEVGHMCLGSGRVIFQNLVKINKSIKDDSLAQNPAFVGLISRCKDVHIVYLASDGGVHSHEDHALYLAKEAQKKGKKVFLHLITDGRDVPPKSALTYIKHAENILNENIKIASISGRFYTMDRDKRWDRIKQSYDTIIKASVKTDLSPKEYVDKMYKDDIIDEFFLPTCFDDFQGIDKNDGIILANFRNDRMREFTECLCCEDFHEFDRKHIFDLICMTKYDDKFNVDLMFAPENISDTLSDVIADHKLRQLHTAETEKYAHVTFFFNGGVEQNKEGEDRILIPSPKVKTYDQKPQMSAFEVTKEVLNAMDKAYDFIVVNYANGDMVGHTGNLDAAIKAVECVDTCLGKIIKKADEVDYAIIITSDHGNCEMMKDENGNILTNHTTFDVYCFVIAKGVRQVKNGGLDNIAPSVLKLMNLPIPPQMSEALF